MTSPICHCDERAQFASEEAIPSFAPWETASSLRLLAVTMGVISRHVPPVPSTRGEAPRGASATPAPPVASTRGEYSRGGPRREAIASCAMVHCLIAAPNVKAENRLERASVESRLRVFSIPAPLPVLGCCRGTASPVPSSFPIPPTGAAPLYEKQGIGTSWCRPETPPPDDQALPRPPRGGIPEGEPKALQRRAAPRRVACTTSQMAAITN
jgi:hypothetical protein